MKIPELAKGTVIPEGIHNHLLKEAKEEELRKKQFKHDWYLAFFSIISGAVAGLISSFIFWLITNSQV